MTDRAEQTKGQKLIYTAAMVCVATEGAPKAVAELIITLAQIISALPAGCHDTAVGQQVTDAIYELRAFREAEAAVAKAKE